MLTAYTRTTSSEHTEGLHNKTLNRCVSSIMIYEVLISNGTLIATDYPGINSQQQRT